MIRAIESKMDFHAVGEKTADGIHHWMEHRAGMSGITWILVADVSRARLFEHRPEGETTLVPLFEDDQPKLRDREQRRASDRPGRVYDSFGRARHAAEPQTSNEDRVREQYARELIDRVHAEARERPFDNLVLVAPPALLGVFRKVLDEWLARRVVGELAKDLAGVPAHELPGHLCDLL